MPIYSFIVQTTAKLQFLSENHELNLKKTSNSIKYLLSPNQQKEAIFLSGRKSAYCLLYGCCCITLSFISVFDFFSYRGLSKGLSFISDMEAIVSDRLIISSFSYEFKFALSCLLLAFKLTE